MYRESEVVELKEKYVDAIIRDIVAFLNANGGDIFVGVTDWGDVLGILDKDLDETQRKISDIITMQIEPNPQNEISTALLTEDGKRIIKISVPKGYKPIYCIKKYGYSSKGCLIRVGTTCKEMSPEEIEYRYSKNFIDPLSQCLQR